MSIGDINNKLIGTKSNKIKKVSLLTSAMVNKIDRDQTIKRLMRYRTQNPLSEQFMDLNKEQVKQPDLVTSLMKDTDEGKQCLFHGGFNLTKINEQQNYVFVQSFTGNFDDSNVVGDLSFVINILVPEVYNDLMYDEDKRSTALGIALCDMFDGYTTSSEDMELVGKEVGNVTFSVRKFTYERLTEGHDNYLFDLYIEARPISARGRV